MDILDSKFLTETTNDNGDKVEWYENVLTKGVKKPFTCYLVKIKDDKEYVLIEDGAIIHTSTSIEDVHVRIDLLNLSRQV